MPSSLLALTTAVINMVWESKAERILDVGPGCGKYGLLIREYCGNPLELDAVEMEKSYITPIIEAIYDQVVVADVCDLPDPTLAHYDLVLMADVIEHIDKPAALALLDRIPGEIIISTPVEFFHNPPDLPESERHISHWTVHDFGSRVTQDLSQLGAVLVKLGPR